MVNCQVNLKEEEIKRKKKGIIKDKEKPKVNKKRDQYKNAPLFLLLNDL